MIQTADFPIVDYASHPAFRPFAIEGRDESAIVEAIRAADAALDEIHAADSRVPAAEVEERYRRSVLPLLEEIRRTCQGDVSTDPLASKVAGEAFDELHAALLQELLYQRKKRRYVPTGRLSPAAERVAADLTARGISLHRIPDETIRTIAEQVLGPYRQRLLDLSGRNQGDRCALALPPSGRYWREILGFLQSSGVIAGASASRQEPLELAHCGLTYSHAGETWWRDCYADAGLPTSRTVYMHNDKDYDCMKVMIYLTDVDVTTGPFCFVPGSHRWRRSRIRSCFFAALDSSSNRNLSPLEPTRTVYYRKIYRHPEFRKLFMRLPRALQGSSHFGDDVLDDSEVSRRLQDQELVITSEVANCMAFVGADGIHRGGRVQSGHRWALQLFMSRVPSVSKRIERRATAAYGIARNRFRGAVRHMVGDRGIQMARSLVHQVTGRPQG